MNNFGGIGMRGLMFAAALASAGAYAEPIEIWECRDVNSMTGELLVTAVVNQGRKTGSIDVAGVTHHTRFYVDGFERRWDFGLTKDGSYRYAFTIEPNGMAKYYEFQGKRTANASLWMKCSQSSP